MIGQRGVREIVNGMGTPADGTRPGRALGRDDMLACKECGEVRTFEKTYKAGAVIYTLRYFICKHKRRTL